MSDDHNDKKKKDSKDSKDTPPPPAPPKADEGPTRSPTRPNLTGKEEPDKNNPGKDRGGNQGMDDDD